VRQSEVVTDSVQQVCEIGVVQRQVCSPCSVLTSLNKRRRNINERINRIFRFFGISIYSPEASRCNRMVMGVGSKPNLDWNYYRHRSCDYIRDNQ